MSARARGHLETNYLQHGRFFSGIVTGADLATDGLELQLLPFATISGRVDEQSGEAVPGALVILYRQNDDTGTSKIEPYTEAGVSGDGTFAFEGLPPGRYFLSASGTPWYAVPQPLETAGFTPPYRSAVDPALDVAYPMTFYPAATSSEEALPIALAAGEQRVADLQLVPEHAVTLTTRLPAGSNGDGVPPQLTQSVFGIELPLQLAMTLNGTEQRLQGIPPGRFRLKVNSGSGNSLPADMGLIDLTGGPVERDHVVPPEGATLRLTLQAATGVSTEGVVVTMEALAGKRSVGMMAESGRVQFEHVPSGEYSFAVNSQQGAAETAALEGSPQTVHEGRLRVTGTEPVEAILRLGAAVRVKGFVRQDGKPVAGAMVLLVPARQTLTPELVRRDESNLDGSFLLTDVSPGDYLLLALTDGWMLPWGDLHALRPYLLRAQPLRIGAAGPRIVTANAAVPAQQLR